MPTGIHEYTSAQIIFCEPMKTNNNRRRKTKKFNMNIMENNLLQNYLESLIRSVFSHRIILNRYRNRYYMQQKRH